MSRSTSCGSAAPRANDPKTYSSVTRLSGHSSWPCRTRPASCIARSRFTPPVLHRAAPDPPVLALMPRRRLLAAAICCAGTMRRLVLIPGRGLRGYAGVRELILSHRPARGDYAVPMIALALVCRLDRGRPAIVAPGLLNGRKSLVGPH